MTPRRQRFWTRSLALEVAFLLATPVVLGAVVGLFEINPVEAELLAPVGSEAHLLLDAFPDDSLVVEIAYQSSAGPPPGAALATLLDRINQTCQKASVTVEEHPFSSGATSFTPADLVTLETQVRHTWPFWGTMSLFYLYLGGSAAGNPAEIGVAYRGSSMAIFEGNIVLHPGLTNPTEITRTVMVHEFGHELGLVGIVGAAPNEDPAHPYHSNDTSDVMYWAIDTTAVSSITTGPPTNFSSGDLADLATVRSTPIPYEVVPWAVLALAIAIATIFVVLRRRELRRGPPTDVHAPSEP